MAKRFWRVRSWKMRVWRAAEHWELDQSITKSQSDKSCQLSRSKNQVNQQHVKTKSTTTSQVVGSSALGCLQAARSLHQDVRDWDIRNLRIKTKVAEVQWASHGLVKMVYFLLCRDHNLAHRPATPSESTNRDLRPGTVKSWGKLSRPSVPCPTE